MEIRHKTITLQFASVASWPSVLSPIAPCEELLLLGLSVAQRYGRLRWEEVFVLECQPCALSWERSLMGCSSLRWCLWFFVNDEPESNPRGGVRISVQRHFKLLKWYSFVSNLGEVIWTTQLTNCMEPCVSCSWVRYVSMSTFLVTAKSLAAYEPSKGNLKPDSSDIRLVRTWEK